jgi:hypothetical protein
MGGLALDVALRRLEEAGALQTGRGRFDRLLALTGGRAVQRVEAPGPLARHALALSGAGAAWLPEFVRGGRRSGTSSASGRESRRRP